MKIYTITLSPAYDVHAYASSLTLCHENLARVESRDAGGKGINISRALTYNGIENTAIVVLGRDNCADFKASLDCDNIKYIGIEKEGRIRENLTIHSENGETRISFSGFSLDTTVLSEIADLIDADKDTIVTFTGSVPCGVDISEVKAFLKGLKALGAKIVLDSRSFTAEDIKDVAPWLIKPNGEEIEIYSAKSVTCFEDCVEFAKGMLSCGIENVMVSLGENGALLATAQGMITAAPPKITALSTIGAGDSTIAGFIAAYIDGKETIECLKTAVAYGSAACLLKGTTPPTADNIANIYQNTVIKML